MRRPDCYSSREEWLEARQRFLGGSDAPVVLGVSPYRGRYSLWSEKAGLAEFNEQGEQLDWGLKLEGVILAAYAGVVGREVKPRRKAYHVFTHPSEQHIGASLDALQVDENKGTGLVQVKNVGEHNAWEWRQGPPLHVNVQVQHEMLAAGLDWGTVVALIGGQELKHFDVQADPRFQRVLIAELRLFWGYVQRQEAPPLDGTIDTMEALARRWPTDSGTEIELPESAAEWDEKLQRIDRLVSKLEQRKRLLQNQIKEQMGDATYGLLPDGAAYKWKTVTRRESARAEREVTYRKFDRIKQVKREQ